MRRRGPRRRDHLSRPSVATTKDFSLHTERVRLRPFRSDDIDALAPIFADPVMMEWYPQPFPRQESELWILRNQRRYRQDGFGLWAMDLLATGELIGDCGLTIQRVDGVDEVEVGWHVKRELWGQGYATEAAREVVRYAFEEKKVQSLISLIRPENVGSWRVAEKLGMHVEKDTMHAKLRHRVYRLDA